ncbi:hypothetical protein D3C71_1090630 [compost metagenome]
MIATLYQIGVDGGLQALAVFGHIAVVEQPGDGARVDAGQLLPAQCDGAVEQRGDLQLPDLLVIDTRHLLLRRVRGACKRGAGADAQQQRDGKALDDGRMHGGFHGGRRCRGAFMLPLMANAVRSQWCANRSRALQLLPMAAGSRP